MKVSAHYSLRYCGDLLAYFNTHAASQSLISKLGNETKSVSTENNILLFVGEESPRFEKEISIKAGLHFDTSFLPDLWAL